LINMTILQDLLTLSHEVGREDRGFAILGEGNTSARLSDESYLVKASGTCLGTLREEDLVECKLKPIVALLEEEGLTDTQVDEALLAARLDPKAKKPSVEAVFHGWACSLPGVNYVGHSHPITVNQVLCSPRARDFAEHRMFPDEIVCGGIASVFIPLTDPGLKLAKTIKRETEAFVKKHDRLPRVILMQNHGFIALGGTWQSVLAAMMMTEKAAKVFVGAASLGGPVFLSDADIGRIANRPDELYRQRVLNV
jgi:rhamnose utilization protein RhaD (predicted bifunctional aldolase and dehydrogenase)